MNNELPALYLVRHGNTDWAQAHKHTGRTDVPLNARGEERARQLAGRLGGFTFARVFTSPLQRARRTCELAGFANVAQPDTNLLEWDYGQYEGQTTADIIKSNPGWDLFRDGAPGGESPQDVARRADQFLSKVRGVTGDAAAFASGHIIRVIAARWLGLEPADARYFFCSTASIGILGYEHDLKEPVVKLWNDDGSLAGRPLGGP